MIEYSHGG